jgi:uncharacterized repeat protein (TIGR03803 family)
MSQLGCARINRAVSGFGLWLAAMLLGISQANAQLTNYLRIHSFGRTNLVGSNPLGAMVQAADGTIYGATRAGGLYTPGSSGVGTVFKVTPEGTGYGLLHQFGETNDTSATPVNGLVLGSDGWLYGGSYAGTVFKLRPDSGVYQVLTDSNFTATVGFGEYPLSWGKDEMLYGTSDSAIFKLDTNGTSLTVLLMPIDYFPAFNAVIQGKDGRLYGTSRYGATNDNGVIFRLDADGGNFTVLHEFTGANGDGAAPMTGPIQTRSGVLFGATRSGGANGLGTIFHLNPDGTGYAVVHSFLRTNDTATANILLEGSDGLIYGTGESGNGAVFGLRPDGSEYALLKVFTNAPAEGSVQRGGLLEGRDGRLYGTTESGGKYGLGTLYRLNKDGSGFAVLRHFLPWPADGLNPRTPLIEGIDSALYGTTDWNGSDVNATVFRVNKDGSGYSLLASLAVYMNGPLWQGANGQLHGMTSDFSVFKLNPDGTGFAWQTSLASLQPWVPLVETADAAWFGITPALVSVPKGAVFTVNSNYVTALLHTFGGPPNDGSFPSGPLLQASDGLFYGVTSSGGLANTGTVYSLNPTDNGYAVVHHFSGDTAGGAAPYGRLLEASDGALYGLAVWGGGTNQGLVYKLRKDGSGFQALKVFTGDPAEGNLPLDWLVESRDGGLYGLTAGPSGFGLLFRLNKDGTGFQVVRALSDPSITSLLAASDGALYGVTVSGGDLDGGTIYRFGQMLSLAKTPNAASLGLAGIPGATYDLQRSTDLAAWTTLANLLMPSYGTTLYADTAAPARAAFYRLRFHDQ